MTYTRFLLTSATLLCLLPVTVMADSAPATSPAAAAAPATPAASATSAAPAATTSGTSTTAATPATTTVVKSGPVTREELPGIIKDTLLNDPDILMQAIQKLRDKQASDAKKEADASVNKHMDELFKDTTSPTAGDTKNANVTVVEFFDYHCGYCRHLLPNVTKLLGEDKKVSFIFKELPILSEDSVTAARAALAVNIIAPDKYFAYHQELMQHAGKFDEKSLTEAAKKVGVNTTKLKAEMDSKEVTAALDKNRALAQSLGIHGTPALIIGHELVPGALDYDDLKKSVDESRDGKPLSINNTPRG
jgi:protein-disulfide isomerase